MLGGGGFSRSSKVAQKSIYYQSFENTLKRIVNPSLLLEHR